MNYEEQISNCKTLDELFEYWKKKTPVDEIDHGKNTFIADGIVDPDIWNKHEKKRILYVLKEAYGDDWKENTLATWLSNDHPRGRTWSKVALWTYGIQNTTKDHIQRYKPKLEDSEHADSLDQIAVINIKKSKGESNSKYDDISNYARYDSAEIKKEFELIDPDIIVCGYTFQILYHEVFGYDNLGKNDNWYYYLDVFNKKRLFIDYYHPANHWPSLTNYYGLMGIYQQALLDDKQQV